MESKSFETHFEEWAAEQYADAGERARQSWILDAVKAHTRWGQGKEVSRKELEAIIDEVRGIGLGGGGPPEVAPAHRSHRRKKHRR